MPVIDTDQGRKFITTEPIGDSGEAGEQKVWDAARSAFAERHCVGYLRYPIFSKVGEIRKEPDVLIVDRELGLVVIEVKSVTIDQIVEINPEQWQFQNIDIPDANPHQQAEQHLRALLTLCDREPASRYEINGRALIALPLITQEQWQQRGFDQLPNFPTLIKLYDLLTLISFKLGA